MDKSGQKLRPKAFFSKKALVVVAVAGAFLLGLGFGSGNLKLNKNQQTSQTASSQLDYSSVEEAYSLLQKHFDGEFTDAQALDGLKSGLAKATEDPYTEYFNPDDAKDFADQLDGSFEGIGAELGKDKDLIVIMSPLSGYPAEKAGLRPKDVILKIDGEPAFDLSISEAVDKIRGPKGTDVKLTILRDNSNQFEVTITRAEINIPSVEWKQEGNLGYIKIIRFGQDTAELAEKAAQELTAKKIKGIVLDLRGNPGGYLDASIDVSGLWLKSSQKVVEERRGGEVYSTLYAKGSTALSKLPTVVLINEGSASASEIVAGALRDNGAAVLVGAQSYGKGSVQQVHNLSSGGILKITFARWFTPSGKSIDKEGIKPDTEVKPTEEDIAAGRDPAKNKAIELLSQKIQ